MLRRAPAYLEHHFSRPWMAEGIEHKDRMQARKQFDTKLEMPKTSAAAGDSFPRHDNAMQVSRSLNRSRPAFSGGPPSVVAGIIFSLFSHHQSLASRRSSFARPQFIYHQLGVDYDSVPMAKDWCGGCIITWLC